MKHDYDDYDMEPVEGLPEKLPSGERLLWQGAPNARLMARRIFHTRALTLYFALLIFGHGVFSAHDGTSLAEIASSAVWMLALAATALAILYGLAIGYAKATVYTVTTDRIVIRFGLAIPLVINIPMRHVHAADMRTYDDGSGDIMLRVARHKAVSYVVLWPNVRPWSMLRAEPALRCLVNVEQAARAIASAAPTQAQHSATDQRGPSSLDPRVAPGAAVPG
ncbi:MAG: photosynthetic complex putative assembly protein PuhB [Pseudomonadota bacterium]